jgi:hypothetical protein
MPLLPLNDLLASTGNIYLYCLGVTGSYVTYSDATKFIRILRTLRNLASHYCSYVSVFAVISTTLYTYIYDIRTSTVSVN